MRRELIILAGSLLLISILQLQAGDWKAMREEGVQFLLMLLALGVWYIAEKRNESRIETFLIDNKGSAKPLSELTLQAYKGRKAKYIAIIIVCLFLMSAPWVFALLFKRPENAWVSGIGFFIGTSLLGIAFIRFRDCPSCHKSLPGAENFKKCPHCLVALE